LCCPDLQISVLEGLESLLNKNFLKQIEGPEGEPRFAFLDSIHDYAAEKLAQTGLTAEHQAQHAQFYTTLAEQGEPHTRAGTEQM